MRSKLPPNSSKGPKHSAAAASTSLRDIDPARTAHIIVDLQNGFMVPGAAVEIPVAREIVPNVNRISSAVRAAGGLNVFLRYLVDPEVKRDWPIWFQKFGNANGSRNTTVRLREAAKASNCGRD